MSGEQGDIDLAGLADFQIVQLRVSPSSCRVRDEAGETRVEPRVMEVLAVLWQAEGRTVSRDQLIERCWGGRAVSDDAVNRIIAKVRQLGRAEPLPHYVIETVPKIGFRLEAKVQREETSAPASATEASVPYIYRNFFSLLRAHPWLARGVALVSVLAILVGLWGIYAPSPRQTISLPHVVIEPLSALQELADVRQLAAVTTHELTRILTAEGLRASVEREGEPLIEGGLRLKGMASFDGAKYQILLTVSDRNKSQILWSGSIERDASDLAGLEHETANEVAVTLRCAFHYAGASAHDLAYETLSAFVHACHALDKETTNSDLAMDATSRLVALAPHSANARALRSLALSNWAFQIDHLSTEAEGLKRKARDEAIQGLALDARSALAHTALATLSSAERRYAEAEKYFKAAIALDESARRARSGYVWLLRMMGRTGAALELAEHVDNRAGALIQAAFMLALTGRHHEAEERLRRLALLRPSLVDKVRYSISMFWEDPKTALAKLPMFERSEGRNRVSCWQDYLKAYIAAAGQPRSGLPAQCSSFPNDWRIRMLARQGDVDGAYELLAQPLPNSRSSLAFLFYPEMKSVRRDPRFMPMAERLGLLSYWRETGNWPDFCGEPDLPYVCQAWRVGEK